MKKKLLLFGVVAVTAVAVACGEKAATPVSPSPAVSSETSAAAADGSTLKATAPAPQQPANASTGVSLAPNLVIANSTMKYLGDVSLTASIRYKVNVETPAGAQVWAGWATPTSGTDLSAYTIPTGVLLSETTYRWRARAEMGSSYGPWSAYWTFTTALPKPSVVWPTTPEQIVVFTTVKYPEYLVATATLGQRENNMAFLRDRMIEAGICGGMDLAWNLKRGVGPRSTDALLHRDGPRDRVIDVAAGFDDYRTPLRLHWIQVEGPPGYDRYLPRPTCQ